MSSIKNVSRNLLRLRVRRGFTQNELSAISGVSNCHISMLETGVVGAKLPVVEKLARALKVEPASMLMKHTKRISRGRKGASPSTVVADNITLHRLERLMTQARLAHRAGLPQASISAIERGKEAPTLSTLDRFASGLRVKVGELLGKPSGTLLRIKKYARFGNTFAWRGYVTE